MSVLPTLTVRPAKAPDAPRVAAIYIASWNAGFVGLLPPRSLDAGQIARWERDICRPAPHRWWVVEAERSIVGFTGIRPCGDADAASLGELDTIAVHPEAWRQGAGRALMAVALAAFRQDRYRAAVLWTLRGYERAASFYGSTGWRPDGAVRRNGTEIRFRHALQPEQERASGEPP